MEPRVIQLAKALARTNRCVQKWGHRNDRKHWLKTAMYRRFRARGYWSLINTLDMNGTEA